MVIGVCVVFCCCDDCVIGIFYCKIKVCLMQYFNIVIVIVKDYYFVVVYFL